MELQSWRTIAKEWHRWCAQKLKKAEAKLWNALIIHQEALRTKTTCWAMWWALLWKRSTWFELDDCTTDNFKPSFLRWMLNTGIYSTTLRCAGPVAAKCSRTLNKTWQTKPQLQLMGPSNRKEQTMRLRKSRINMLLQPSAAKTAQMMVLSRV